MPAVSYKVVQVRGGNAITQSNVNASDFSNFLAQGTANENNSPQVGNRVFTVFMHAFDQEVGDEKKDIPLRQARG